MKTPTLCLVAATAVTFAAAAPAREAGQRLYVYDVGTGKKGAATFVEYALPKLKTAEYSPANYGVDVANFGVAKQTLYFAQGNQGKMYALAKGSGLVAPTVLFASPGAVSATLDSKRHIYSIDPGNDSVDEYTSTPVQGGGTKTALRVLTFKPQQAQIVAVDHQDNVWVYLNDLTIAVYGPKGTTPIANFAINSFVFDIKVDAAGTVWILTGGIEPYFFTNCTPDPKGNIKRTPLIYSYVNLQLAATLYSHENDTNSIGHLAVANDGRVYYSAGNEILDYDPGTQCPNDSLIVSGLSTYARAPLALDAQGNLYAADPANASIYAYPPGTAKPFKVIQQVEASQGVQLEVQ